jgi:hypothetical protein
LSETYGRKYGSNKSQRPECFANERELDLRSSVCRSCDWKLPCKRLVAKAQERREEEAPNSRTSRDDGRRETAPEDFSERETDGGLGFFGALVINSGLYAVGVTLGEAQYAVEQIPRFPYSDPFEEAVKRGRKKAREDE